MNKFIFAGYDSNKQLQVVGIDKNMSSYQRNFDCSTKDKAKASLGMAMAERDTGESAFIDLRDDFVNIDTLSQLHLHLMATAYNSKLDKPADTRFVHSYIAFARSICEPSAYYLSHQEIDRFSGQYLGGEVSRVTTLEEARTSRAKFISEWGLGGSTDLGGEVYRNGVFEGYISYNGGLWQNVPYGGQSTGKELDHFLNSKSSANAGK